MSSSTSSTSLSIAFLTRYEALGASSRVRALQYLPHLEREGLQAEVLPLLSDEYVRSLYDGRRAWREVLRAYARRLAQCLRLGSYDLIWMEKELLPMLPFGLESALLGQRRFVLDLDDAIFHNYDLGRPLVRRLLGDKIDRLMRRATLVTAGNSYLAERAHRAGAAWIEQLPSTVPLSRYPTPSGRRARPAPDGTTRIVWIGSPATVHYLGLIRDAVEQLATRQALELRVIGAQAPQWAGLRCISIAWSEQSEAGEIADCDIGVMPLDDSPWEQGKCSFKLIQYMACGLPVVASPVGMNRDVVIPGHNGLLATDTQAWIAALDQLVRNPASAAAMGEAGRRAAEEHFSVEAQAPRLAAWLRQAAAPSRTNPSS